MPPFVTRALVLLLLTACTLNGQDASGERGTMVIVVGQEGALPVPTLVAGSANRDVADLLFLRLAELGPTLTTRGDTGFEPRLARSWTRRDSLTVAFDLDPRARWHDGTPVTSRDVTFSFGRFRDPTVSPQVAQALQHVRGVEAEGNGRVVFTFSRAYGEQVYDLIHHVQILPAHLLESIPHNALSSSAFARAPVGSGPYRWVRRDPGRLLELAAVPGFFLGEPKIRRVIFLLARDPDAQLNLLLDGTGDALQNIAPSALPRIRQRAGLEVVPVPTFSIGYLLFNLTQPGDPSRPHPILGDPAVRRALALATDRETLVRAALGNFGTVPEGPVAQLHWFRDATARGTPFDPATARRILAARGWRDTDGDGIVDRQGVPLTLRLNFPGTNVIRGSMAPLIQSQWRAVGVHLDLVRLDGPVWAERRNRGEFEVDFSQGAFDPSPMTLNQGFSCAAIGGANVGGYCNPALDSLIARTAAMPSPGVADWQRVVRQIVDDAPAVFVYALTNATVVHQRFLRTRIPPTSYWSDIWRWSIRPGQQLPRDRDQDLR